MADREQRLQLEVTRLKSDRDALINTRNEYNKELQEERTLQIRLLQERDTLIAEERARHAQQIHEKDRLLQERDATIVELRNQRLNDRTCIQDLKREIEDMRAQQDVEAPPVSQILLRSESKLISSSRCTPELEMTELGVRPHQLRSLLLKSQPQSHRFRLGHHSKRRRELPGQRKVLLRPRPNTSWDYLSASESTQTLRTPSRSLTVTKRYVSHSAFMNKS